jgi:hypothetical protein
VKYIPIIVGVCAGIATPLIAALLQTIGFGRCIDTQPFFNATALVVAGIGAAIAVTSAASLGAGRWPAIALVGLLIGSTLLAVALLAPPYHGCAGSGFQIR